MSLETEPVEAGPRIENDNESTDGMNARTAVAKQLASGQLPAPPSTLAHSIAAGVLAGGQALIARHQARRGIEGSEVMSVDEAAAFLGLDRNTVYDAAGRGEIPHRRLGKRILLSRTQLVAWLGACKAASGRNG